MAAAPISRLPKDERQKLLDDLNYLNTGEIRTICKRLSIPYRIAIETRDGSGRRTREEDRKGVILHRIRHFLRTGVVLQETWFRAGVVCFDGVPDKLTPNDKLFYGRYDKKNYTLIALLKDLTGGKFRNGAIARILMRDFWTRGEAPTFKEYARAWLTASKEHKQPNPEWAFLSDRARKTAPPDWKKLRAKKASNVIKTLKQITGGSLG